MISEKKKDKKRKKQLIFNHFNGVHFTPANNDNKQPVSTGKGLIDRFRCFSRNSEVKSLRAE